MAQESSGLSWFGEGVTLQHALHGARIFDCALATVIWHEMAHLDGANEAEAQLKEEQLWLQFVVWRRVDGAQGMTYLPLLRKRLPTTHATR